MEKIFILIFILAVIPYFGLPKMYDTPIYVVVFAALAYSTYIFLKKNINEMDENGNNEGDKKD